MADNPDITAGTASVTVGTKVVTGVGTFWSTDEIRSGDLFASDGYPGARIDTVNSDTSITLKDNWRGATLPAGSSYYIRYQPDGSRYAALLAAVRKILTQPLLTAFAGLTGAQDTIAYFTSATTMATVAFKLWARSLLGLTMAADKLPYGIGPNSMGLADFTAAGRALLDDPDASAQLTTLGVSAFAKTVLDDASGAAMFNTMGATQTLAQSGYQKLPSGMILQWGSTVGTASGTGGLAVTLPVAFSGNQTYVAVGYLGDSAVGAGNIVVSFVDQTSNSAIGFRFKSTTTGNAAVSGVVRVTWLAMGY